MPKHFDFTTGPTPVLNLNAAAEMIGCVACIYARDQMALTSIIGQQPPEVTDLYAWLVHPTNERVAVAMWGQTGHLYIAFGGTHTWHQWPRHATGSLSAEYRDHNNQLVPGVGVHGYHQVVARGMWDVLFPLFPPGWEEREIRVTGHSLGGSTAQLVAWRIAQMGHGEQTQTITMGAPRVILGNYAGPRPLHEWRVTNVDDLVTYIPFRYQNVVVETVQAILMIRSGRPKGDQALKDTTGGGPNQ